jgi:hypothetical protein
MPNATLSLLQRTPFPRDGEWTRDSSWEEFLVWVKDPAAAHGALEALRKIFPPDIASTYSWQQDQRHPILIDYAISSGRFELLELGAALARIRTRDVSKRPRVSNAYVETKAELRVGMYFSALGIAAEHEPCRRESGPDWLLTMKSRQQVAVEVTCPRISEAGNLRVGADAEFIFSVQRAIGDRALKSETAVWCTLCLSLSAYARMIEGGRINKAVVSEIAESVASRVANFNWLSPDGTYALDDLGEFDLKRGLRSSFSDGRVVPS